MAGDAAAGAATSPEVAEQLENALLNSIFRQDGAQAEMRDQIRAQIRQTESFQKMLSTGDEQINSLLNNTTTLATLQASITGELMKNSNPAQVQNNEISQNSPELSNPSQNTLKLG